MAAVEVFVVGSLHFDVVVTAPRLPRRDETLTGSGVEFVCGGKGGNQAVAAALHGARTAMAGRVGDDLFAPRLLAHLDAAGVERAQLQVGEDSASGMSVAIVDREGDYGAVIVSGANLQLETARITVPEGARIVVLQNEIAEAANIDVAQKARAAGARVVLNAAPARALTAELLDLVHLLVVNRVEAAALTGLTLTSREDAKAAASRLATASRSAIVTLGAGGVAACDRPGETRLQAPFQVDVVSAHGAGDVFVGALASRLAAGTALEAAIRYAQAAAALYVSTPVNARLSIGPAQVHDLLGET